LLLVSPVAHIAPTDLEVCIVVLLEHEPCPLKADLSPTADAQPKGIKHSPVNCNSHGDSTVQSTCFFLTYQGPKQQTLYTLPSPHILYLFLILRAGSDNLQKTAADLQDASHHRVRKDFLPRRL